ncbi:MAG: DUF1801 domain-containing protein [Candidatus Zixiibacteriota bacterium]
MAELKTKPTGRSVKEFLNRIDNDETRKDCQVLARLMKRITGAAPKMWGDSIVGFGDYHYTYGSGREGDWFLTGFSPRKQNLTLYLMFGLQTRPDLVKRIGKVKTGKGCLYIKTLSEIDLAVLEELVRSSVVATKEKFK